MNRKAPGSLHQATGEAAAGPAAAALEQIVSLQDAETLALARLPAAARDYYCGGANDEITLRENRAAYERIALHYRVLRDVSERDPSTTVLGTPVRLPVLVAPTAFHQMAHPDGELATARAVLIGRPALWGLACAGEAGVARVLQVLHGEIDVAMALTGCRNLAEIDVDLIRPPPPN